MQHATKTLNATNIISKSLKFMLAHARYLSAQKDCVKVIRQYKDRIHKSKIFSCWKNECLSYMDDCIIQKGTAIQIKFSCMIIQENILAGEKEMSKIAILRKWDCGIAKHKGNKSCPAFEVLYEP